VSYDYLSITNEVLSRFNEVELTSANFTTSRGFQTQCKNAINSAVRFVNQQEYTWPFNHASNDETLVVGQTRYNLPTSTKLVDYETFRIRKSDSLNVVATPLKVIDYKEYIDRFVGQEDDTTLGNVPKYIFRTPDNKYGLVPYPDKAYTLTFDYYTYPEDLSASSDVPTIPERFRSIIVDGACMYGYEFRGETGQFQLAEERFKQGVKNMQSVLLNRYDYMRSTYIPRSNRSTYYTPVN
jgi:hypothetical protein